MTPKRPDREAALQAMGVRGLDLGDIALVWSSTNERAKERDRLVALCDRLGFSLVHARELVVLAREEGLVS